jgi:ATP synthase mitochondrial F1 complex assembly factor 2
LKKKQDEALGPVSEYLSSKYNITLPVCTGISIPKISAESIESLEKIIETQDAFYVVGLEAVASISKSVGIGIALLDGELSLDRALFCARLEENMQIEEFGKVEGQHDVDEAYERMVMSAAKSLVALARDRTRD